MHTDAMKLRELFSRLEVDFLIGHSARGCANSNGELILRSSRKTRSAMSALLVANTE